MKRFYPALPCLLLTLVIVIPALRAEEDTVTIPKSRLEELERKAADTAQDKSERCSKSPLPIGARYFFIATHL